MKTRVKPLLVEIRVEVDPEEYAHLLDELSPAGIPVPIPGLAADEVRVVVTPGTACGGRDELYCVLHHVLSPHVLKVLVFIGDKLTDAAAIVLGTWLYDKLKGKDKNPKIRVNQTEVEFSADGITRIIKTTIENDSSK